MTCHEFLSLTPELKKNVLTVRVNVLEGTSIKKTGKLTNYNSPEEIFISQ